LKKYIGADFDLFSNYYNINSYGKWEKEYYHLIRSISDKDFSKKYDISENELREKVKQWNQILSDKRALKNNRG